jgi:two-component system, response regulator, stage 0 sporulation protein F
MSDLHKILYVDDEPINLRLFQINFRNKFDVTVAKNAMEALELLKNTTLFEVVISDMKMPVMNGLEFIKLANSMYPHILYFILTGYGLNEEMQEAIDSGICIKYFGKPFNYKDIELSVRKALAE